MNRLQAIRKARTDQRRASLERAFLHLSRLASGMGLSLVPFGSYAEGRIHAHSDLDIGIPGPVGDDLRRQMIRGAEATAVMEGIGIDLVFESETPIFYSQVIHAHPVV